ncbi:MAG: histidine phosphatase family protein [Spirochaeta sp.]|jgi:broad specificity phosphatase PhoE|nr:histidine phosphatase family protein [Spirochaeta sp.]
MDSIHEILTTLERPARFYFVRHGESEGNVEGKMQGHKDRHLTDLGRSQAEATARWFAETEIHVDHLFTSPLIRARETAEILAAGAGYPAPEPLDSVLELHTGVFTDHSFPEIQEKFPAEYAEFVVGSWESVPEAESITSLTQRGLDTWEELVRRANATERSDPAETAAGAPHQFLHAGDQAVHVGRLRF